MKYHFIGIGGIGISGLAKYMHYRGHQVSGSDIRESHITHKLEAEGLHVTIPQCAQNIKDPDCVIHSAIIKADNPEVLEAKARGIRVIPRREALLEILHDSKVYAVAGAHGKSTTSAILSELMHGSAIIGAESKAFGSNVRYCNESDVLIFEADESDGSFLNANAYCAIVTNAEPEHMEYYGYDEVLFYGSYKQFIENAPLRILNAEDPFLSSLTCKAERLYPSTDIRNIEYVLIEGEPHTRFELLDLGVFEVWGFGAHIALDAALAILAAMPSVEIETIRARLLDYKGIKKRFDILSDSGDCVIIDDYGHHPTEIKATMEAVKTFAALRGLEGITAIWQPHKYSRTVDNLDAFRTCFEGADRLIILPVWAAGEAVRDIDFATAFAHYDLVQADHLVRVEEALEVYKDDTMAHSLKRGLIVGFGAGDITYQLRGE
ncbi:MAG: UDP-N-acetylmuramate--L-alanine ligase [Campylobacterales bacterium]|nr:UDP-N-acetylmuramate--L-alanine ligase [Campylobacterales bacterium]